MGAAGRDFHNFNVVFRDDASTEVVAFTATQIPYIDDRTYPAKLAGERYPDGIRIHEEDELSRLIRQLEVEDVVFAYPALVDGITGPNAGSTWFRRSKFSVWIGYDF